MFFWFYCLHCAVFFCKTKKCAILRFFFEMEAIFLQKNFFFVQIGPQQ